MFTQLVIALLVSFIHFDCRREYNFIIMGMSSYNLILKMDGLIRCQAIIGYHTNKNRHLSSLGEKVVFSRRSKNYAPQPISAKRDNGITL